MLGRKLYIYMRLSALLKPPEGLNLDASNTARPLYQGVEIEIWVIKGIRVGSVICAATDGAQWSMEDDLWIPRLCFDDAANAPVLLYIALDSIDRGTAAERGGYTEM
ncbi:hypothetical protein HYFRA_00003333 [Hymenoscyphus fraxineus]|uniref:Uncharacterized protein n=1 Tax=Hymenoscyphus fraxineus TaxID=746836 RepID=A0A9N9PRI7_9HELO|nr:hypothetical protein HYFRA_00003333 [Hymenoscyphus fraxineus]